MNLSDISLVGIKGVLLDFDNTFYDYTPAHEASLLAVFEVFKNTHKVSYEDFISLYSDAQKKVKLLTNNQAASHSRLLYFQKMIEHLEHTTNIQEIVILEELYWSTFEKHMIPKKEIFDFIKKCKENGIKTCIVTDLTAGVQFRKMRAIGVDTLTDFVVTSEEAGAEKPHSAVFTLALEKLQLSPSDVIMIGDDTKKDIDGAHTHGIKAYMV